MYVTCVIAVCDMTHSCISFMYVTRLSHTRGCRWDVSFMYTFIYVTLLMDVCDIIIRINELFMTWRIHIRKTVTTHSMWHDSWMDVTWLIPIYDMTHWCMWVTPSYRWHKSFMYVSDSFIYMTWRSQVCEMTHSYMWHDSYMYVTWLIHIYDMTHWCMCCTHAYICHDMCMCLP